MALKPCFACLLAGALMVGSLAAPADETTEPGAATAGEVTQTRQLRDFIGFGIFQIDLPPSPTGVAEDGSEIIDQGVRVWMPVRQAYVWPDRTYVEVEVLGQRQISVVMQARERTLSPAAGYIVERTYKNVPLGKEPPIAALQLSMVTYSRIFREQQGRLLPAEDLDALKERHEVRLAELAQLREELAGTEDIREVGRAQDLASEMARIRDDLSQIEIRRIHPCRIVEYPNVVLLDTLLRRGLASARGAESLTNGKTTVWITEAEGLPIKMETTDNNGRLLVYFCFTQLKINSGLKSSDLILGAPPGTRQISLVADLRDPNWERKMDEALDERLQELESDRRELGKGTQVVPTQPMVAPQPRRPRRTPAPQPTRPTARPRRR
jgi:hypothetical protein